MAALSNSVSSQQSAVVATATPNPPDDGKDSGFPRIIAIDIRSVPMGRMMSTITIQFSDSETRTFKWSQAPVYNCPTDFFGSNPTSQQDLASRTRGVFEKALKHNVLNKDLQNNAELDFEKVKLLVDKAEDPTKAHQEFLQREILHLRAEWRNTCNTNYCDGHGSNAQYPSPYHSGAVKKRKEILETLSKLGLTFKDMDDPFDPLFVPDSQAAHLASLYGTSHSHS